ncbi:MAG: hypothetical protein P8186_32380 [Anaerolineae bacterium]
MAEPGNPIAWNRYAYVYSAPVHYTDSSGHFIDTLWDVFDLAADALNCLGDSDTLACYMLVPDALALALPFVPGVVDNALKATFIISDELANRFSRREWFRSGSRIPEIQNIQQQIDRVLRERFPGLRDEEFTFRVWKTQEFFRKVGPDERFFISR